MKKQDRYKLLNYAKNDYSKTFERNYEFKKMSKNYLLSLLKQHKHSKMCIWSYCCYGLYTNCWQDPIEDGIWGMSQVAVDKAIEDTIKNTAKICRRDNRILYCENEYGIHVVIVARDVMENDFLIVFTNDED